MGYKEKTKKGNYYFQSSRQIALRWRYNGVRYHLYLPYAYSPENVHYATIKAAEIKLDIKNDTYCPKASQQVEGKLPDDLVFPKLILGCMPD